MIAKIRGFIENKKRFISFVSICAAVLIVICIGLIIMGSRREALSVKYDTALQSFNDANAKMLSENMAAFEKNLLSSFSQNQLVSMAQNKTKYGIMINGESLGKNQSVVYATRPTIAILLSENYGKSALNLLPRNIVLMGSVIAPDKGDSLIKVTYGNSKLETKVYDYYYGKTFSYIISDLKAGDIVTLEVSPVIAGKIGLEDNIIEIFYNKDFVEESEYNAN